MTAILMSIHREWWEKILAGEKTVEIRKSFPREIDAPFTVYVHVAGETGIQGEFTCSGITLSSSGNVHGRSHGLTREQLAAYGPGRRGWYCGWHVDEPKAYETDVPVERLGIASYPQSWMYADDFDLLLRGIN